MKQNVTQYDVIVITETQWKYDSQWQDKEWKRIHTGIGAGKGAGILLAITRRIGGEDVRHQTVVEGRLVHAASMQIKRLTLSLAARRYWPALLYVTTREAQDSCPRRNLPGVDGRPASRRPIWVATMGVCPAGNLER